MFQGIVGGFVLIFANLGGNTDFLPETFSYKDCQAKQIEKINENKEAFWQGSFIAVCVEK